jgi:hypothetical protein
METIDDQTEAKSSLEYTKSGKIYGKVTEILNQLL